MLARISVLRSEDGGCQGPFTDCYRPNHNFGGLSDRVFYIGQVDVPEGTWIHPGETCDLCRVSRFAWAPELLREGRTWRIQVGGNLVATAELLAVMTGKA